MRTKGVIVILTGVLVASSIAAPLVNIECDPCGNDGKWRCSACGGIGAFSYVYPVECSCSIDPKCPICHGEGIVAQTATKPCEKCNGKGWIRCPDCRGDGRRNLLERIPDLWRGK